MTMKQKQAFEKSMENGGVISSAMLAAGYSPNSAHTPQKLTESLGWQELVKQLDESKAVERLNESLDADKWNDFTGDREADHVIRLKGSDMIFKLNGRYPKDDMINDNRVINVAVYGQHAELSNRVNALHGTDLTGPAPVQGSELAPQSPQDDTSSQTDGGVDHPHV